MPDSTDAAQPSGEQTPEIPLPQLDWHDAAQLQRSGQAGESDPADPFARLPQDAQQLVHRDVWQQSRLPAGVCVHFVTDAADLWVRWTLDGPPAVKPYQTRLAQHGLDLYVRNGRGAWSWAGVAMPGSEPASTAWIAGPFSPQQREFCLQLPLGAPVVSCEVGLTPGAKLLPPPASQHHPIVFYGTSIVQGAGASRPGMAYPSLVARRLDRPTINLGLSQAAWMDREMIGVLGRIDAAAYVLDCLPNMDAQMVAERTDPAVRSLRDAQPDALVILVEDRTQPRAVYSASHRKAHGDRRTALQYAYQRLCDEGIQRLHYVHGEQLLGHDGEATVDGSHPSDLGAARMADVLAPILSAALEP